MVRVLVVPGTGESGLEVLNSLRHHREFIPVSASTDPEYARGLGFRDSHFLPNVYDVAFHQALAGLIDDARIDIVLPAHDEVVHSLRNSAVAISATIASHPAATLEIVRSKSATYRFLSGYAGVPEVLQSRRDAFQWDGPLFIKPDRGQGSRGAMRLGSSSELIQMLDAQGGDESTFFARNCVTEFLEGPEFTVDCFTDLNGSLQFAGQRQRVVTRSGISVHTVVVQHSSIQTAVEAINSRLQFTGPWFAQFRESPSGLKLLEIGPRISGSSGIWRSMNINLAALAVHQALGATVSVPRSPARGEATRALTVVPTVTELPAALVMDFDDTLLLDGSVNAHAAALLRVARLLGIRTILSTRHAGDLESRLQELRVAGDFDEIHHLRDGEPKSSSFPSEPSWFFDDSFAERREVAQTTGALCFDASAIPMMLDGMLALRGRSGGGDGA